ncbi:MAG: alkaline phosphatase PhoX, partial [Gaiella sp.]
MEGTTTRRQVLRAGLVGAAVLGLGGGLLRPGVARGATVPFGPLGAPDPFGVRLPAGFSAKVIAITGQPVGGSGYLWHRQPDGAQTLATPDGGWLLVQNGEDNGGNGGVSVLRFSRAGAVTGAYSILTGTKWNCHGGITPWKTWLSCEEFRN